MAILRSRGGRSLASSPSSSTAPVVGSSSPAIIRSTVDLPQPDGPSSTMNSPSFDVEIDVVDGDCAVLENLGDILERDGGHRHLPQVVGRTPGMTVTRIIDSHIG